MLYLAQLSGERLQDNWSSGIQCHLFLSTFQWGYFIMLIEWMTFVATHTRGANWKIPEEEFPWICKKVMANGMLVLRL